MVMNKSIALWAHPRSMSTSVERSFRERGDCACHHEPFMYFHYLVKFGIPYPGFDPENERPRDLHQIAEMLITKPEGLDHVFFKDMSYYIIDQLEALKLFMEQITSIFLIRDPRFSLASYAHLDPKFSLQEAGLEAQWNHYSWLKKNGIPVMVIEAETISTNPQNSMMMMLDFAGLPFIPEMLSWEEGRIPNDWIQAKAWHKNSLTSTGFNQLTNRDPDTVFEKAQQALPHLDEYLKHHQPYYEKLKAAAIKI